MVLVACLKHSVRAHPRYHARAVRAHVGTILPLGATAGVTLVPTWQPLPADSSQSKESTAAARVRSLGCFRNRCARVASRCTPTNFPHYQSWFGTMVGQFLNGKFGALETVDPHFAALLYAGDRFEAKGELTAALAQGKLVLADRYIASNLAHQTGRVPAAQRIEFVAWLEHLEYNIYGLPREDRVIYLRVPPAQAQALVSQKAARSYTTAKQDIQESSLRHLQDAAEMYDLLAKRTHWATIECVDRTTNDNAHSAIDQRRFAGHR